MIPLMFLWLVAQSPPAPLLRGAVEAQGGALRLVLRNLDAERDFNGVARVSLGDGPRPREAAPVTVALRPEEERSFALDGAGSGSYTMLIYDERGTLRFIHGGTLGPVKPAAAAPPPPRPEPEVPAPPVENEVRVSMRRAAADPGKTTLVFEVTSRQPLGQVVMTLRGSGINETRQAVFGEESGTIPFVVPSELDDPLFTYELKDQVGRTLAVGQSNLRRVPEAKP
jgi:hypothetical protein